MSTVADPDIDVVIAGGGPVGLAAAIEARLVGLTVAVVEPRADDIDKACGEGLMPGALPLLARLGVDPAGMPLRGVRYTNGRRSAEHLFRTGIGRGVRRTTLQHALSARAAQLGVVRIEGRVDAFEQDATGVTLVGATSSGGRSRNAPSSGLRASWLVGADGLHSTVRRLAGLERTVPMRSRRFGIRQHFALAPWSELIEVHWARQAEVYVTPAGPDLVGIAILGPARTDFESTVAAIPELADRLRGASPASSLRGAGPFLQRATRAGRGRVLLVGDASGYVDAITGEGLRLGFDQARLAIEAVVDGDATGYHPAWRRSTRNFRVLTTGLVRAATSPARAAIVPLSAAAPALYGAVVERLAQ